MLTESMGFEPMRDGYRLRAFQARLFSLLSNFPKTYTHHNGGYFVYQTSSPTGSYGLW